MIQGANNANGSPWQPQSGSGGTGSVQNAAAEPNGVQSFDPRNLFDRFVHWADNAAGSAIIYKDLYTLVLQGLKNPFGTPPPNPSPYSEPPIGCGAFRWANPAERALFPHQPSANDVSQGRTGDCYFEAALAALAYQHPEKIPDLVEAKSDGTYVVHLYRLLQDGTPVPQDVNVDLRMPADFSNAPECSLGPLWTQVVEKAYAKLRGGYDAAMGGQPSWGIMALTGKKASDHALTQDNRQQMTAAMQAALVKGQLVCASTRHDFTETGAVIPAHDYTVEQIRTEPNGRLTFVLRNPWGSYSPGAVNGVFEIPADEFFQYFNLMSLPDPA